MKQDKTLIPFEQASGLLRDGDVLLFRGTGLISYFIKRVGSGPYSHVGMVSGYRPNGKTIWECVEFREWRGGRIINLERYVNKHSGNIDVYRASPYRTIVKFDTQKNKIETKVVGFNNNHITKFMRQLTGLPYGWARIWAIAQIKMPILRMIGSTDKIYDDNTDRLVYPVCSTAVAHAFAKIGYDLTPNRSDQYMEPSDVARSAILHYLFTLV